MSQKVDELFGEGATKVAPKTRLIITLLGLGCALTVLGLACSSVPGGLIVLWAWTLMEKEIDRVESGYLPEDSLPALRRLKGVVWLTLGLVVVVFMIQSALLFNGFYFFLWGSAIEWIGQIQ